MGMLQRKLRHIYGPFLLVTAGSVAAYSVLAWLLVYKTQLLNLDEDVVTIWLPFVLAWVPLLVWVWPRIKVLKLETKQGRIPELYMLVAAATVIGPTVIGQTYLARATATLTHLDEVAEINRSPDTKYYAVTRPCLRREDHQFHWASALTGRQSESLTFTITVVVPFCGETGAQGTVPAPAWLGITFTKSMRADRPDDHKEAEARMFAKDSEAEFAKMDLAALTYLEQLGPGAKRRGFESAIRKSGLASSDPIVLLPHHDVFEERTGERGAWALWFYVGGAALWLVMVLIPGVHGARLKDLEEGTRPTRQPHGFTWRSILIPTRQAYGVVSLAYLNVIVFLFMVFAGLGAVSVPVEDLVSWGGLSRPLLHGSGLLRLVTSQFIHDGMMHIANNLYGLVFAGIMLESIIGGRRLLVAYLLAGTCGGIASVVVHPVTVTVGASGSIFGLFGVLFGLLLAKDERVVPLRQFLLVNAGIYVGLNLLLGAVMPGVDNAAHLGGLLAGLAMGPILRRGSTGRGLPTLKQSGPDR